MYMSLGESLGRLGRQTEALDTFDRARALFRGTDEPGAVPWADDRAAASLIELERVDEALDRLRAALSVREAQRDLPRIAYANYRLGWTLRLVGQFEEALSHLSVAAELFDDLDELEGRARCDLEAANALTSLGQVEEADELYRRTRAVFDALGHDSQVVLTDANRAVLLARNDQLQEAADLNRSLLTRAVEAGTTWLLGDISNHLARNLIELDQPEQALAVLDERDSAELEPVARVQSAGLRARALLATGRRAAATRAAEEGLELAADAEMVAERAELYEIRGLSRLPARNGPRVAAAERDLAHAVALYLAAGLTDRARELSKRFLPRPGITVQRGGGFLTEQPTLPLPEPKPGEPRPAQGPAPGSAEPRND
jgi:tetratricopeptide (TPR) repeat protein